ncbi:hypothetical protein VOLCADRAFT_92619 [Volvox carteri f. nagariensis]|uniref:NAD(P)-binding domain-containing protein n=1 Tax=Volvox carteri f. nagariensis TaxID=3068 RepID=D8U044_VOLCA|nr:uncharacterized protein VOLCADRAFT_92619 [Volvox carteri f. nagariensis]EFJ46802.1 hypothetical protein VOLCADRAFT_92619 [Volvox carteri f. nagariensis]|eukprot:XP_002952011.1 hypothetical protein VOLCADRAFT_92619 [Volvox carteri f. nagariensis]
MYRKVSGTCRTQARVDGLRAKGWAVDIYDPARGVGLNEELTNHLEDSPYVLSSVPPLAIALYDPVLSAQKALLRTLAASGRIAWFGYLSSTGIYGPGRSVLDTLKSELADLSASKQRRGRQRYTARCHVYDICTVLNASIAAPRPGSVYNVVDDDPAPRTEVVSYARSLLAGRPADGDHVGVSTPPQLQLLPDTAPDATAAATATAVSPAVVMPPPSEKSVKCSSSGGAGSDGDSGTGRNPGPAPAAVGALEEKRVCNRLIKSELGLELRYPSYMEGVAAIHRGEYWPLSVEDLKLLI